MHSGNGVLTVAPAIERDQVGAERLAAKLPKQRDDLAPVIRRVIDQVLELLPERLRERQPASVGVRDDLVERRGRAPVSM